ncbi:MAG: ATP-binding cassette domain-containing protein [Ruminiclostridium sp.]|nr:ATP-binding cassette domain-containing protein [Ruminiclostridium sp.]
MNERERKRNSFAGKTVRAIISLSLIISAAAGLFAYYLYYCSLDFSYRANSWRDARIIAQTLDLDEIHRQAEIVSGVYDSLTEEERNGDEGIMLGKYEAVFSPSYNKQLEDLRKLVAASGDKETYIAFLDIESGRMVYLTDANTGEKYCPPGYWDVCFPDEIDSFIDGKVIHWFDRLYGDEKLPAITYLMDKYGFRSCAAEKLFDIGKYPVFVFCEQNMNKAINTSVLFIIQYALLFMISSVVQIRISRKQMEISAKENGMSYALISGIQKIKLSGAEKRFFTRWLDIYSDGAELVYAPPTFIRINSVITTAIGLFSTIILYWLAVNSGIDQSNYMAFNAAYGMVMGSFTALSGMALNVGKIRPILEMAEPILSAEPEVSEKRETVTKLSGSIELDNVYFRYSENMPYVVKNLSLKISSGEYVAIVGKTGCGKSTLMRLLLGFEKPEKGAVYYDSKDINSLDLGSLRRKIGTVMQSGGLFQGDIYSNIVISAPQLTLDDAWEAAEKAGIADDIRDMPMGMHTLISEGQGGISGGQKQRLMIARAIAPKPKILIFDEATSALDNKTQKQVSEALDVLGCTRIVVAHRLSTIRNCDRILVLDKGSIIEEGSYDELIEKGGLFAELVERQRLDT